MTGFNYIFNCVADMINKISVIMCMHYYEGYLLMLFCDSEYFADEIVW